MLNTRYVVMQNGQVQRLPEAMGNCWFVNGITPVESANDEILKLNEFDPANEAVVNVAEMGEGLKDLPKHFVNGMVRFGVDSSAYIVMEHKNPADLNTLTYRSHHNLATPALAVFSEIYYSPDWKAYIDGKPAEYIRANYILRAMLIPAGDHVIEFRNEAPTMHRLDTITLVCSIATVLIVGATLFVYYRRRKAAAK